MRLIRWINNHPMPVTLFSLMAVCCAMYYVWAFVLPGWGDPRPLKAYYYDAATGDFFPGGFNETPPIQTPSGSMIDGQPAGVRANVFSCSGCSNPQSRYVAYLDTFTPEAHEAQRKLMAKTQELLSTTGPTNPVLSGEQEEASSPSLMNIVLKGHMVAKVGKFPIWEPSNSKRGAAIVQAGMKKCDGGQFPEQCFTH